MRHPQDELNRVHVVSPDGRIFAACYAEGVTSRYVDGRGRLRPEAEAEGYRLLISFAKERAGFMAAYAAWEAAAEQGIEVDLIPDEDVPPSILKLRAKQRKHFAWPGLSKAKGSAKPAGRKSDAGNP